MGMGTAMCGWQVWWVFSFSILHVTSVIFTSFSTQMSAANLLFTYLLFVGTNILVLLNGKQCPEEMEACGSSILYAG